MKYEIVDGRVRTRALEYHILDHCNLKCDHCCSFSPLLPKWMCEPEQFEKDLRHIAKAVAPQFLKIVGGEPLLHPKLVELLRIAREVNFTPSISITTNAHLLERMPEEGWKLFDMLTVSIYPSPPLSREHLHWIRGKAKEHSIKVSWKVQDKFNTLNRSEKAEYEETKEIFKNCWIHHRCNSIKNGRFYSCTRPQYIQKLSSNPQKFLDDGVELSAYEGMDLALAIKAHLEAEEPLNTCFLCNGGHAPLETHNQMDARTIAEKRESMKNLTRQIDERNS